MKNPAIGGYLGGKLVNNFYQLKNVNFGEKSTSTVKVDYNVTQPTYQGMIKGSYINYVTHFRGGGLRQNVTVRYKKGKYV